MAVRAPTPIDARSFLATEQAFDAIIDARSPGEYAIDHVPGAINLPVLDDQQRALVGTINAERSPFEAHRLGAQLVSENIARILAGPLADKPRQWRALVYCWRGGQRSGSLATVLARIGWRIHLLEGGYKAWRRAMLEALRMRIEPLSFIVLAGRTGSGKSRVLERMCAAGAQVLDLEALAEHRGSVLGLPPGVSQPSQKAFESRLWSMVRQFDPARPVWVESESRKIGAVQLPEALIVRMRASPCAVLEVPRSVRAALLIEDYAHLIAQPAELKRLLESLRRLHGNAVLEAWTALIDAGAWADFVERLLADHYDPAYDRSMAKNYLGRDNPQMTIQAQTAASMDILLDTLAQSAMSAENRLIEPGDHQLAPDE
ncbi:MAG: tRNA 2-selenouridine(34) synthase MnmH [Burkholderiaceae bacterium]